MTLAPYYRVYRAYCHYFKKVKIQGSRVLQLSLCTLFDIQK